MDTRSKHRVLIAWILLLSLMPLTIVKATHFHDVGEIALSHLTVVTVAGQTQLASDSGNCPICDFHLPPFIEAAILYFYIYAQLILFFAIRPCAKAEKENTLPFFLRAPPVLS